MKCQPQTHNGEGLAMYASQVKHEFPNVKFLKDDLAQTWTWLYLAVDDCPFTLGTLVTLGYTEETRKISTFQIAFHLEPYLHGRR